MPSATRTAIPGRTGDRMEFARCSPIVERPARYEMPKEPRSPSAASAGNEPSAAFLPLPTPVRAHARRRQCRQRRAVAAGYNGSRDAAEPPACSDAAFVAQFAAAPVAAAAARQVSAAGSSEARSGRVRRQCRSPGRQRAMQQRVVFCALPAMLALTASPALVPAEAFSAQAFAAAGEGARRLLRGARGTQHSDSICVQRSTPPRKPEVTAHVEKYGEEKTYTDAATEEEDMRERDPLAYREPQRAASRRQMSKHVACR